VVGATGKLYRWGCWSRLRFYDSVFLFFWFFFRSAAAAYGEKTKRNNRAHAHTYKRSARASKGLAALVIGHARHTSCSRLVCGVAAAAAARISCSAIITIVSYNNNNNNNIHSRSVCPKQLRRPQRMSGYRTRSVWCIRLRRRCSVCTGVGEVCVCETRTRRPAREGSRRRRDAFFSATASLSRRTLLSYGWPWLHTHTFVYTHDRIPDGLPRRRHTHTHRPSRYTVVTWKKKHNNNNNKLKRYFITRVSRLRRTSFGNLFFIPFVSGGGSRFVFAFRRRAQDVVSRRHRTHFPFLSLSQTLCLGAGGGGFFLIVFPFPIKQHTRRNTRGDDQNFDYITLIRVMRSAITIL